MSRPRRAPRVAAALLLAGAATGCAPAPSPPSPAGPAPGGWSAVVATLPADPSAAAGALEAHRRREGLPLSFRALGEVDEEAFGPSTSCGERRVATVRSLIPDDPALEPRWLVEYDDAGAELIRFPLPEGSIPAGVTEEAVLVPFAVGEETERVFHLRILPDGSFSVVPEAPATPRAAVDCPALPAFSGPGGVICVELDAPGGARRFAFALACA